MISFRKTFDRKQVIPYIMIGDDGLSKSLETIDLYIKSGCSIIELGIPFSDPTADGPIIQAAGKRSLKLGTTVETCINFTQSVKAKYPDVKLILMTYLNPLLQYGLNHFFKEAAIDGVIIPDMPIEEYDLILPYTSKYQVAIIPLITIDSTQARIKEILKYSAGFVYLVSLKGTTGNKKANVLDSEIAITKLRSLTTLPIVIGFGIKTREQIDQFHTTVDGVIIASQLIHHHQNNEIKEVIDLIATKKCVFDASILL